MLKMIQKIAFLINHRLRGSRVSPLCYIKNPAQIHLGASVKIHSHSALDASSSGLIQLGDGVTLNRYAYITASRAGVAIGANSQINHFALINGAGGVMIGRNVLIGPGAQLISYQHNYQNANVPIDSQGYTYEPITVEDDVWIGSNAVILAGVTIGRGCVIGAGAVVTKSCAPYSVLAGVPARVIKKRDSAAGADFGPTVGRV